MLASPLLAAIYNFMGDKLPMPYKFTVGMFLSATAFLVLPLGRVWQMKLVSFHHGGLLPVMAFKVLVS